MNLGLNEAYRGLGWSHLKWMFTTLYIGHYMPLTWVTLGLDYVVWGMDPFGYHLTNLLLHAASAVVFFFIAVRLLALAMPALSADRPGLRLAAAAAALLFSLHPLRVESVAWASERRDVLCSFFYLLAVLAYLRAAEARAAPRPARLWYAATLVAGAAALLSKSMAVSLPVVLVLLDVYPLGRLSLDRRLATDPGQRRVLLEKAPFFLLSLAAGVLAIIAVSSLDIPPAGIEPDPLDRLNLMARALAFYPWKTLVPLRLSPFYVRPEFVEWWSLPSVLSLAAVLAMTGLAVGLRRRWPALAAAWWSYVVILAPVLGIFRAVPQLAADHFTYLPCLGWALVGAGGVGALWLRLRRARPAPSAGWQAALVVVLISAGLGSLAWRQTRAWRDTETLLTQAVRASPSAFAYGKLASVLTDQGRITEAIAQYENGLRLDPGYGPLHLDLGIQLARQGRRSEAMSHYLEAIRLMPNNAAPYNNLGNALAAEGRTDEAIERYQEALRRQPAYAEAHSNLAAGLVDKGRLADATGHYREAVRLRPDSPEIHYGLARALAARGETAEAMREYKRAIAIKPGYAEAHNNLGSLLLLAGRADEAAAEFREALRINPALREPRINLEGMAGRAGGGATK